MLQEKEHIALNIEFYFETFWSQWTLKFWDFKIKEQEINLLERWSDQLTSMTGPSQTFIAKWDKQIQVINRFNESMVLLIPQPIGFSKVHLNIAPL